MLKHEQHASDDESNNNRTASDYLSKLLNSRDLSNDLDNSLPTLAPSDSGNFSYVPMKSSSTPNTRSSSSQHKSTTQKRTNRTSNSNRQKPAEVSSFTFNFILLDSFQAIGSQCQLQKPTRI